MIDLSWLIRVNHLLHEFGNPKIARHWWVPLSIQAFFGKKGTEEHDFQESFGHYRVKVFFASLSVAINDKEVRFSKNDLGNLRELTGAVVNSNTS